MKVTLSYQELHQLIENKSGKEVTIEFIDSKTIKLSYLIKVMMVEKLISVDLRVAEIDGYIIKIAFVDEEIMQLAIAAVHQIIPFEFISIDNKNSNILIDTAKIKECEEIYNQASLGDISFEEDGAHLLMNLNICNK